MVRLLRSYFWDLSASTPEGAPVAWGVTANLLIRRTPVRFQLCFPKTGGGEDIAFCLDTVAWLQQHRAARDSDSRAAVACPPRPSALLAAPRLTATHPWWDGGAFTSVRFWRWACGDGVLAVMFPQHSYVTWPNAVEVAVVAAPSLALAAALRGHSPAAAAAAAVLCVLGLITIQTAAVLRQSFVNDTATAADYTGSVSAMRSLCACMCACGHGDPLSQQPTVVVQRLGAALLAATFKVHVDLGHVWAHLRRGRVWRLASRFDWHCGLHRAAVAMEQRREAWDFLACVLWLTVLATAFS